MTESVSEKITLRLGSLSSSERRAAQALMANYPVTGLGTVAEFSKAAGISSPSVLRFIARLGFSSYPEFQASLKEELAARMQSPLVRAGTPLPPGVGPFLGAIEANLRDTFAQLPQRQIEEIAARLAEPRGRLFLVGGRFTDPIARYMAAHLTIVRPGIVHLSGQESTWMDHLLDANRHDTLLLFDIRRYARPLLTLAETAAASGAAIILFTDQWLSPVSRLARYIVAGRTVVTSPWDSSVALLAVAEVLLAETTRQVGERAARRIRDLEKLHEGGPPQANPVGKAGRNRSA